MLKHIQTSEGWAEKNLAAKGFTLIELLVVVIILGILAAVAIFAVGSLTDDAQENTCDTELKTVKTAIQAYKAQDVSNRAPNSTSVLLESNGGNLDSTPENYSVGTGGAISLTSAGTAKGCTL